MLEALLIASMCQNVNYSSKQTEACSKALEASSRQTKVYDYVNKFENYSMNTIKANITPYTGETVWVLVGIAIKAVKEKNLEYTWQLKNWLPVDAVTLRSGTNRNATQMVSFKISF